MAQGHEPEKMGWMAVLGWAVQVALRMRKLGPAGKEFAAAVVDYSGGLIKVAADGRVTASEKEWEREARHRVTETADVLMLTIPADPDP